MLDLKQMKGEKVDFHMSVLLSLISDDISIKLAS